MLMSTNLNVTQNLKVDLAFDNGQTKSREISVGDLIRVTFNDRGLRKEIEGEVLKIYADPAKDMSSWYMIVDGSLSFCGQRVQIKPMQILDLDIIQKKNQVFYISSPNDSSHISAIRLMDGVLQVSIDDGYSWITPNVNNQIQEEEGSTGDDNNSRPGCNPPDDRVMKMMSRMETTIKSLQETVQILGDKVSMYHNEEDSFDPGFDDGIEDESY